MDTSDVFDKYRIDTPAIASSTQPTHTSREVAPPTEEPVGAKRVSSNVEIVPSTIVTFEASTQEPKSAWTRSLEDIAARSAVLDTSTHTSSDNASNSSDSQSSLPNPPEIDRFVIKMGSEMKD